MRSPPKRLQRRATEVGAFGRQDGAAVQARLESSFDGPFLLGAADRIVHRALSPWYRRTSPALVTLAGALLCAALMLAFAVWLLGSTYSIVLRSGLPGGSDGPMDAYRHTLASAQLSYVLGPGVVTVFTTLTERHPERNRDDAMDTHNNLLGAAIGAQAGSLREVRAEVLHRVRAGGVDRADPGQVTWLPSRYWSEGLI